MITLSRTAACRFLLTASLWYAGLSNLLFLGFWLCFPLNWICVAVLAGMLLYFSFRFPAVGDDVPQEPLMRIPVAGAVSAGVLTLLWALLSGIGGLGFSFGDILCGDSVLYDLVHQPWPICFTVPTDAPAAAWVPAKEFYFVYYLGFYLVPGALGRLCDSFTAACWAECLWSCWGTCIAVGWFFYLVHKNSMRWIMYPLVLLVFIFFRSNISLFDRLYQSFYYIFHWGNSITLLYMSPQHTLAAWMAAGAAMAAWRKEVPLCQLSLLLTMCLIITPFALIGTAFFWGGAVVVQFSRRAVLPWIGCHLLLFCFILLPAALFLTGNAFSFPHYIVFCSPYFSLGLYLWGLLISIGIPGVLLYGGWQNRRDRIWCGIVLLSLFGSTLVNMGYWNDFPFRVSTCGLFILMVLLAKRLEAKGLRSAVSVTILSLTLIGGGSHARFLWSQRSSLGIPPSENIESFIRFPEKGTVLQRMGDPQAFFFRKLFPQGDRK